MSSIHFSPVLAATGRSIGDIFTVNSINLPALGRDASPLVLVDDFRVRGQPFGPHPHAGFSAVTYVFEDSAGSLRSRDSLGNNIVVGPGGIVWSQAGRGMLHEELPADDHELHGLQFFVNLHAANKMAAPEVLHLHSKDVPEWKSAGSDRVRVVVGSYEGLSSPLTPVEPFRLLDVTLRTEVAVDLPKNQNAVIYVYEGNAVIRTGGREAAVSRRQGIALRSEGGRVILAASGLSRLLVLSGTAIPEPVMVHGPFIMTERAQIDAAEARFRAGQMGFLKPYSET